MYLTSSTNQPGTLTLKSKMPMDYSRGVLTNKWYIKREGEPRDFELWSGPKPNLHQSSYRSLCKTLNDDIMLFETESHTSQEEALKQLRLMTEQKALTKPMVDEENRDRLEAQIKRHGHPGTALPAHKPGHDQQHFETTYLKDYVHPFPELLEERHEEERCRKNKSDTENKCVDNSFAFRKMVSHFSDIDGPRRAGINTFHVQDGKYPNLSMKHQIMREKSNNLFQE